MKNIKVILAFALACMLLVLCPASAMMEGSPIVIGSKEFTEQLIFGHILKDLIEGNTDYKVDLKEGLGGTMICFTALKSDEIDLYMEYTGTAYAALLQQTYEPGTDVFQVSRDMLQKDFGIEALEKIGFNNTYCFAMPREKAEKYGISKVSDLIGHKKEFILAPSFEFYEREDGLKKMLADYEGIEFADVVPVEGPLKYISSENDQVDVIVAFSTDGMLRKFDMVVLEDDRHSMFPYESFVLVRGAALEKYPGLKEALNKLAGQITDTEMSYLNYLVDAEQKKPEDVAHDFLVEKGLI